MLLVLRSADMEENGFKPKKILIKIQEGDPTYVLIISHSTASPRPPYSSTSLLVPQASFPTTWLAPMMTAKVAPDENLTTASSKSHASLPVSHPPPSSPRLSVTSTTNSTDVSLPNANLPPNPNSAEPPQDEKGPLKTKAKLVGFVAFTAAAAVAGPAFSSQIIGACNWVRDIGFIGAAIWVCFMALWITCLLPTTIPELACGFMWGLGPGIAVAVPAKLAGSTLSFIVARYFMGDSVEKQVWAKYKYSDAMRQLVRGGTRGG